MIFGVHTPSLTEKTSPDRIVGLETEIEREEP